MRLAANGNLFVCGTVNASASLNSSDRSLKSMIERIDTRSILAKVAAIQGLHQLVKDKDARILALEKKLAAIEKRLGM